VPDALVSPICDMQFIDIRNNIPADEYLSLIDDNIGAGLPIGSA